MNREALVRELTAQLGDKKPAFLADVRSSVSSYIEAQGSGCLTLIERRDRGDITWELAADPSYVARLVSFCRAKPHDGNAIDSALTPPIADLVSQKFQKLYDDSSDEIAESVLRFIMKDEVLSKSMVDTVIASSAYAASAVRNRLASTLLENIQQFLHTSAGHAVTTFVGKTVAATVSKPIGAKIAAMLVKALSTQLKVVIAKVIASGALKGVIATAVKKFVIFAVAGAIVKAVAAKFGISTMAAFMWILIPFIVAYIAYEVHTFPRHLAEKVSAKVVEELSGRYTEVNTEVCDRIVAQIVDTGIAVIMRPIADSAEVQAALGEFAKELGASAGPNIA